MIQERTKKNIFECILLKDFNKKEAKKYRELKDEKQKNNG